MLEPTARRISVPAPGAVSEAAIATVRYCPGATLQMRVTILPVIAGATATAALVIASASLGCFATAVAAAIAAISGRAQLTAPTNKGALPGFISRAARTASLVANGCSSKGASLIHFTSKSGTSGAGVLLSI